MTKDLVSVIMPSHNSSDYIIDSINSIRNQTYSNWELLITDDASKDNTWKIIQQETSKDSRILPVRLEKNQGAAVARNHSIKRSRGRFIAFCDSDDQWVPEKLETQINFMKTHKLGFTFSGYYVNDQTRGKKYIMPVEKKLDYRKMLQNNYIGCLTAIYDTSIVDKVYMPLIKKRHDWALWLRILKKIPYAAGIQEPLAIYRVHGNSLASNKIELIKHTWSVYNRVEQFSIALSAKLLIRYLYMYFRRRRAIGMYNHNLSHSQTVNTL